MQPLQKGRYRARLAQTKGDIKAAQRLRFAAFSRTGGPTGPKRDRDNFDETCQHMLIETVKNGTLVGCFRVLSLASGADISKSYAAQYYNLDGLAKFAAPLVEMGRFCLDSQKSDPDIVRLAWAAMARYVMTRGAMFLFGCVSFQGCDPHPYGAVFDQLTQNHLAPPDWTPGIKAPEVIRFSRATSTDAKKMAEMMAQRGAGVEMMPALLRSYLAMGGRVSDHAVVDRALETLHVFTGLSLSAMPPARRRLLTTLAR